MIRPPLRSDPGSWSDEPEPPPSSRAAPPPPRADFGASPFHVKGNVYIGTKTFFETRVDGGLASLYGAIDDPRLLAFIQQKFLPVAWYDVLPAVPLIRAEARAMGLTVKRYLHLRSAYQADKDLSGVYRYILKLASAELVALKLPRLFTQIFDFGTCDLRTVATCHVEGVVADYPAALHEWFSTSLEVYSRTAIKLTGAREVAVSSRRIKAGTSPNGEPLASMQLDLRWSE